MGKKLDRTQSVAEYIVAFVFITGGISLFFAEPITNVSPILSALGSSFAAIVYGTIFVILGVGLTYAKIRKRKKMHKNFLLAIYLACIFTFFLEYALFGPVWYLIDSVVIGIIAATAWMRWKFKTEYLDAADFRSEIIDLKK